MAKPSRRARDRMRAEQAAAGDQPGARGSERGIPAKATRGRRANYRQRSFLDRFGGLILVGFAALGIVVVGFIFLQSSSQKAYACDSLLTPGPTDQIPTPGPTQGPTTAPTATPTPGLTTTPSPTPSSSATGPTPPATPATSPTPTATATTAPSPSPSPTVTPVPTPSPEPTQRLGFVVSDLGRNHIVDQTVKVEYDFCPPGSGPHWNVASGSLSNAAPVPRGFYQPDQAIEPEQWVHDLEHGAVIVLYSCGSGGNSCPSSDEMAKLKQVFDEVPPTGPSITCQLPNKVLVLRFDDMTTRFALVAWDRELLSDTLDVGQFKTFAQQFMDGPAVPETGVCL